MALAPTVAKCFIGAPAGVTMPTPETSTLPPCSMRNCEGPWRNGGRGGRAFARNQRLRKLLAPPQPPSPVLCEEDPPETAHEANLLLDRHFPWLLDALAPKRTRHSL